MKFDAVCTNIDLVHRELNSVNGVVQVEQMWVDATFNVFRRRTVDQFTLSFDLDEAPNIGDKYEIEVRPCK